MAIIPNLSILKRAAEFAGDSFRGMRLDAVRVSPVGTDGARIEAADVKSAVSVVVDTLPNGEFSAPVVLPAIDLAAIKAADRNGRILADGFQCASVSADPVDGSFPDVGQVIPKWDPIGQSAFRLPVDRLLLLLRVYHAAGIDAVEIVAPTGRTSAGNPRPIGIYGVKGGRLISESAAGCILPEPLDNDAHKELGEAFRQQEERAGLRPAADPSSQAEPSASADTLAVPVGPTAPVSLADVIGATMAPDESTAATMAIPRYQPAADTSTDPSADAEPSAADQSGPIDRKRGPIAARVDRGTGARGDGIEIRFSGVPSVECRADLKRAGFRWSRSAGCWYARRSTGAERMAQIVENVYVTMAAE